MVFARMSVWKYKRGLREKGLRTLDELGVANAARATKGHRGSLVLFPVDEPDSVVMITLWESEEALKASAKGVFQDAAKKLEQYVAGTPEIKNCRVYSAEVALTYGPD